MFKKQHTYVTGQSKRRMSDALLSYTRRGHECIGLFLAAFHPSAMHRRRNKYPQCTLSQQCTVRCRGVAAKTMMKPLRFRHDGGSERHLRKKLALQMSLLVTSDGVPF